MDLIRAWGFTYKTVGFYWVKRAIPAETTPASSPALATGSTPIPSNACSRGGASPRRRARDVKRLVVEPRREHSRNPTRSGNGSSLVEGPYLELFARETRPGWDAWGEEAGLFDAGTRLTSRIDCLWSDKAQDNEEGRERRQR